VLIPALAGVHVGESFLKNALPKWKKWPNVWKNLITHYTPPRVDPEHDYLIIDGDILEMGPEISKGNVAQIKSLKIFPMFGTHAVKLYKSANEAYVPPKTQENCRY
jgi:hypothetical protein